MLNTGISTRSIPSEVAQLMAVAGQLTSDTLILQYIFNHEQFFIWAINKQGMVKVHEKVFKEYLLDRETKRFHNLCEVGKPAPRLARWLAEELIEPFNKLLENPLEAAHRTIQFASSSTIPCSTLAKGSFIIHTSCFRPPEH
jgi:hypothetical protein